jgi:Na+/melibiose symporter-like transporter
MGRDFYAGIFSFIVGVFAIYMFFHATKERFLNNKTYEQIKYITPLPISFNFFLIKILFIIGGLLCLAVGIYGIMGGFLQIN